jgi:hypothetical protein
MIGQLDPVRHPEVGLGLLLLVTVLMALAAIADDIALVPLMTADGMGIALVVVFVELEFEEYLGPSLQP